MTLIPEVYEHLGTVLQNYLDDSYGEVELKILVTKYFETFPDDESYISDTKLRHIAGMMAEYMGTRGNQPKRPAWAPIAEKARIGAERGYRIMSADS